MTITNAQDIGMRMLRQTYIIFCAFFTLISCFPALSMPQEGETDTSRINNLIKELYLSSDSNLQFELGSEVYELGRRTGSIRHKSRSEIVFGVILSEHEVDSAYKLINRGIVRYLNLGLFSHAANGYYQKGYSYEINGLIDSAFFAYQKGYDIAREHKHLEEFGDNAFAIGYLHKMKAEYLKARFFTQEAYESYQQIGNTLYMEDAINQLGTIYDAMGLYSEAIDSYLKTGELAREIDDVEGEIFALNNIGGIYSIIGDFEKSSQSYIEALEKARIHSFEDSEASLLNNLAENILKTGDTIKAIKFLNQSLEIKIESSDCIQSYPLEGLGAIYIDLNKLDSAELLLNKSLRISSECEDLILLTTIHKSIGRLYVMQKRFPEALKSLTMSLKIAKKAKLPLETEQALYEIYRYHKARGNTRTALSSLERYRQFSDSVSSEKNKEKAAKLAAEYTFRKTIEELEVAKQTEELEMTTEIRRKEIQNQLSTVVLISVFILAFILLKSYLAIQKRNKKLQELNEEKNKLMGIVAHDLRNPLNVISGLMPILKNSLNPKLETENKNQFELMEHSSQKMSAIIDRILDISAVENMKLNLNLKKENLNHILKRSCNNFKLIAENKGVKLEESINLDLEANAIVDSHYLEQVIDNLLSNAIKFSDAGKSVFVSISEKANEFILNIKDEGPGISEEEQKTLFNSFHTASNKSTDQEKSSGLGLYIVKKFVKAMNGDLEIKSKKGKGTSFLLLFSKA